MTSQTDNHFSTRFWLVVTALIILVQVLSQYLMGRIWICECGYVKLFEAGVNTPGNSQHLFDWYTPSHIIHGFLFYGLGWLILRRKPVAARLALSALIEAGWEILENSPIVIDRYRTATMAIGYTGDSILNSGIDMVSMIAGFFFAARAPVWLTIAIAIGFEILTALVIRDNLTLNVLMLVWPIEAVKVWQGGV
ncbi:DUF2585 domain-containing protein [Rhizobium glycinendophyticum]|uniref:UPF0314 protein FJQ55_16280 n=2 Tax=Rhizobium glycinendophyticum TaxID=2589807 RepID=A0A504UQL4_9HYPH|nr:DUF2585 domain-containing protein [Rhizobium glycinendophyticum]TPP07373.1 DUF2585 domain-containing protein [Rhizobium glycinendophyticum]